MSQTADEIWAILREVAESQKETDRKFQETDRKIKAVTAGIGKLGNRLGDFIEDAVRPAAVRLFRERGIDVHEGAAKCQRAARRRRHRGGPDDRQRSRRGSDRMQEPSEAG